MSMERERGLILQHGVDGPPGVFGDWLGDRGLPYEVCEAWRAPLPADPNGYAWLCALGSEHTPGKPGAPQWVDEEVRFIRGALDAEVPVLGLCFGGQALAAAAGASVGPSEPPEVGWMEVSTEDPALVPSGPWLHFHFDLFDVPPGATEVARSEAGPAAFVLGPHLGLQFHPEGTAEMAAEWARDDAEKLAGIGVRPEELRAQAEAHAAAAARHAAELFDAWWRLARPEPRPA